MFVHRRERELKMLIYQLSKKKGLAETGLNFLKIARAVVETFHVMESEKNPYTFA